MPTNGLIRWRFAALASVCLCCCAPDTSLIDEGTSGPAPPAGANAGAAALIDPVPGAASVPVNLAAILVRFPAAVVVPEGALTITSAGQRAGAGIATPVGCPDAAGGVCFRVPLAQLLVASATYVVALGDGIVDGGGQPVSAGPVGQFVTAAEADLLPPVIAELAVAPSGPCVTVSFRTDEPAAASVFLRGGGLDREVLGGAGATSFSVAASIVAFGAGVEVQVQARATDLAGNIAETASVTVVVPIGLLSVAITEVHPNAAGPEPAQEFVEVRNLGPQAVDVGGLLLEDAKGADVLPTFVLDPAAFALIVPSTFDAASAADTVPRNGTALIRVDARLGADGLANGGEVVRLRTAEGTVVSSYGGGVDTSPAKWAGKSITRVPEDACDQPASWTRLPSPATPGWRDP